MKFAEYVEARNFNNEAFLQELFANEEFNPEGLVLNEFIDKLGQWASGLFGGARNMAGDVGRSLYNLPGKIADKASEYGSAFAVGTKIEKAKQLQNTLQKIAKALNTDPDFADMKKAGAIRGVDAISKVLSKFLEKGQGMKSELDRQRMDRGNIRLGASSGDASTRAGGFDRRAAARGDAAAGSASAKDAARRAREIA
jgi:hypothetical protein